MGEELGEKTRRLKPLQTARLIVCLCGLKRISEIRNETYGQTERTIIDYITGRLTILFEPNEDFRQAYEELKDCEKLSLEIKRYRRKRSLDANAYYWVLIGKLAKALELSNPEAHNMMLCRYGQPELFEGKAVYMTIPDTEDAEKKVANATDYHLQPTSQVREGNDGIMYQDL